MLEFMQRGGLAAREEAGWTLSGVSDLRGLRAVMYRRRHSQLLLPQERPLIA